MNDLLNKINETFDNSIRTSNEEVGLQLKILKNNINILFKEANLDNEPKEEVTSVATNDKKKVLVVDDSSIVRNYIEKICSPRYNTLLANGGEAALDIIKKDEVDLILLDLMMPGVDGFAVLDYLKDNNSNIPVIIISGDTTKETIDRAFTYSVIDMIEKPFPEKTILDKISRVLE